MRLGKCRGNKLLQQYAMFLLAYVQWVLAGRPRCLDCHEQPAMQGFFCMRCHERLEEFLAKRRRSRACV
jgi:hypothetical protein